MKKNLVLSLSILFFIQLAAGQNQINYLPLNSCDPSADMDDLKSLDKYFTSTILVGMGESTHGTHEFFTMRHRVFKYLVLNHGFNTFFLEADYSNCLRADRYINGAEDDLHKVTLSLGLWPWETEEMADLISWMKEYNSGHDENKLSFIGCDMQQINTTIDEIDRIIMAYDSDLVDTSNYVNISQEAFYKINDWETLGRYKNIVKEKKALINKLDFRGNDKYIYQTLTRHLDQIVEEKYNPKFYSFRDVKMAENILYHLENNTEIKGFFWA
ncbi:MAG TPA: hypothetical protein ENJ95_02500, partial [Bacteroidetes bacterium]|nr:hypothetical protein [Bacteroidota bacterium]